MPFRAIAIAALSLSFLAAAGAAAPGNGKLAYFRNPSVFTANEDGSGETKIATLPTSYLANQTPLWSPDGAHIAYLTSVEKPGLVEFVPEVVDSGGGNPKRLAADGAFGLACWLDATTLVVLESRETSTNPVTIDQDLYALGLDGSVTRLTDDGGTKLVSPQGCAPDGRAVAYSRQQPDYRWKAAVVGRGGSGQTEITPAGFSDDPPAWSPLGDRLAFARAGLDAGLYVADPNGANARRLTPRSATEIRWSPDAAAILFTYSHTDYSRCFKGICASISEAWSAAADGSGERLLAGDAVAEGWSPDGARIIFGRGGRSYFMNPDGSCETVLPPNVPDSVAWQPLAGKPVEPALACADLKVSADTLEVDLPLHGQSTYTLTVLNQGNETGSAVRLDQPASGNLSLVASNPSQGTCTSTNGFHCDLGALAPGATATVAVNVKAGGRSGYTTLSAHVFAQEPDGDPFDNDARVGVSVFPCSILGTAGPDTLYGTPGRDTICGWFGNDTIYGGAGNDVIYGGEGVDLIYGGKGRDTIYGGGGNDVILARDGQRDVIDCGPEEDTAVVDRIDVVSHCRTVYRPHKPKPKPRRQARAPR